MLYMSADARKFSWEELIGGPLSKNTNCVKKTANHYELHKTYILEQLIIQWTDEHKTEAAGQLEDPKDLVKWMIMHWPGTQ